MSDFIENQVQSLLAGQGLENYDICDPHVPISDITGMSDISIDDNCRNDALAKAPNFLPMQKKMKDFV